MPEIYLDTGESVQSVQHKAEKKGGNYYSITTVQDVGELPGWGTHYLNDPAIIALRRRYGSKAYIDYLESRSYPQPPKPNVFATQAFLQTGTRLNPGVEVPDLKEQTWQESLKKGDTSTVFAQAVWQSSPWGIFDKDKIKASDIQNPMARKVYYLGSILGEASDVAAWTFAGLGVGKAVSTSTKATEVIGKLGGKSKVAQAVRGTLKGLFIGGEVGKVLIKRKQGYNPFEIAIDIGGDIASFKGFEWGLKKGVEPKLTEMAIQEKVHKQSQHIVYGERGESIGVGLKGTGEKGWKQTVYSAKTKSISASAIDKQRGWVIEEGLDVAGGKGRISWIGRIKKFMTSAEFKASGYNPEKPFIVKDVKPGNVMGGGRSVQVSKEILQPGTVLSPTSSISGSARSAIISAIKSVEWVKLPTLGFGGLTLLGELRREKKIRKPQPIFELEGEEKQKIKPTQAVGEIQKEKQGNSLTPIMTYKDKLIWQIKQELKQDEKQEQKPDFYPDPYPPKPAPQPEPQIEELIPRQTFPPKKTPKEEQVKASPTVQLPRLAITTVKPPSQKPTRIVPPTPLKLRISLKPSGRGLLVRLKKAWARKVEWGDIRLFGRRDKKKGGMRGRKRKSGKKRSSRRKKR